jgi:hypothetical protein
MENKELKARDNRPVLKRRPRFRVNDRVVTLEGFHKVGRAGKIVAVLDYETSYSYRIQYTDGKIFRKMETWLKKLPSLDK